MKKDALKKLTLSRETLRRLDAVALREAAGAGRTDNTCDVSGCLECLPDPT
ncbi:MAG TPA: hypothetical protein VFE33_17295 [Thermoanaerobaculia bacterium]|nr:hypothetical protein [Thermoanaerobaculia bacterium]